jgi:hypothetical protein
MKDLFSSNPDVPSPINSNGGRGNASGGFDLKANLERKVTSNVRKGSGVDKQKPSCHTDAPSSIDRYYGSFSLESKRHVWDLLGKHPKFGNKGPTRTNRIDDNTREVLPNDPHKAVENGGKITYS